jgi:hypothetical protein
MYKTYLAYNQLKEYRLLGNLAGKWTDRIRNRNAVLQNNRKRHTIVAIAK